MNEEDPEAIATLRWPHEIEVVGLNTLAFDFPSLFLERDGGLQRSKHKSNS